MRARVHGRESGSAIIEAAYVTPLLLVLVMGTIQVGHLYGVLTNLRGASAVGARAAILGTGQTAQEVCETARNAIVHLVHPEQIGCETSPSTLPATSNTPVTVTLTYSVPVLASHAALFRGPTVTLSAQTTMQ
jgi:Flp pilus assembly protein TadG